MNPPKPPPPGIETLRRRYAELHEQRITAAAHLRTAERHLADLQRQARERYGTDDPDALAAMLDEMRTENDRRRAAYQRHLDEVAARLAEVERTYSDARGEARP
jgi:DNA-binding transcriptional MerR regulator